MTLWFRRGLRYSVVGISTFVVDLALLFFFIDFLHLNVLLSTGLAFSGALTLNYIVSRKYVFPHSERDKIVGYLYFLLFATAGLIVTVFLMWLLVTFRDWHFAVDRMIIALVVGFGNFYANLFINFKVAGVELEKAPSEKSDGAI